jgi:hypothetical protein
MSETINEQPRMTEAQVAALGNLCARYNVDFDENHYLVHPETSVMMPGYAEGWLGGRRHANPKYQEPEQPARTPTIYVGCDPEGNVHS